MSSSTNSFLRLSNATGIRRFGEQLTWIQEPDIFHMRLVGTLEADELRKILLWQTEWGKSKPRFFVVCDVSQLQSMSRDARRVTSEQGGGVPTHSVTITYGASYAVRVMAEMTTRARKVLGVPNLAEVVYVATQADALEELERRRQLELDRQSSK
jgi:hypothetical protein